MMTTLLTTIADALIEFILSLLRDPAAAAEFENDPDGTLARNGLTGVCAADVQAVRPVVIDHPQVSVRSAPDPIVVHVTPAPQPFAADPIAVRDITQMAQTFHFDNRSTIIDQSVNQSIWAEGDVTQQFDHEAVIASGDGANAAGHDVDNSTTDATMGDVSIGNTDTDITVDDSYNDSSTDSTTTVDATVDDSFNDSSSDTDVDTTVDGSFNGDGAALAVAATGATDAADDGTADNDSAGDADVDAAAAPVDSDAADSTPAAADSPAAETVDSAPLDSAPLDSAPLDSAPLDSDPVDASADLSIDDAPDDAGAYPETEPPIDVAYDEP